MSIVDKVVVDVSTVCWFILSSVVDHACDWLG